jgi:hypothetical protein
VAAHSVPFRFQLLSEEILRVVCNTLAHATKNTDIVIASVAGDSGLNTISNLVKVRMSISSVGRHRIWACRQPRFKSHQT